jgi:hypothetical protein
VTEQESRLKIKIQTTREFDYTLMMKFLILIISIASLFGCAHNETYRYDYSLLGNPIERDYVDHLSSNGDAFLKNNDVVEIKLNKDSIKFLITIYDRLVLNNEALFSTQARPSFHFIKNKTPFLFSLPNSQFFFSSGLIEKYLKSEEIFVAALASEVIRSQRLIYEKKMIIPTGSLSVEKMVGLCRLKSEIKVNVNEWAYTILKRSGFDASAYLNWIQVQNRNTLDFSFMLGDVVGISKEEHLFKNYLSRQGIASVEKKINEANSSKEFYKLINNVVSTQ